MAGPIAYYEVRWRLADGTSNWRYMRMEPNDSQAEITGVDRTRTYEIQARSVGPTGLKSIWVDISHTVAGNSLPTAPSGFAASGAADGVRLTWSLPAKTPADVETCVERATASGGPFTEITRVKARVAYIEEKVDGTFYYRVRTTNYREDFSAYSAVVSASPNTLAEINADIAAAMTTAQNAQAAADGSIQTFLQTTAPGSGMSYGDIWYDTDDNRKPYRWNGSSWIYSPNDALALTILQALDAQATADGKVKTYFQSTAPASGMSLGDLWFNTTTKKLFRWSGSDWNSSIGDITLDQLAGAGVNMVPDRYSTFESTTLPPLTPIRCTIARVSPGQILVGLRHTITTVGQAYSYTTNVAAKMSHDVGRTYLFSTYFRCSVSIPVSDVALYMQSNNAITRSVVATLVGGGTTIPANTWVRLSAIVTTPTWTSADTSFFCYVVPNGLAIGAWFDIDGLMVEPAIGSQAVPSAFMRGTSASDVISNAVLTANAQSQADSAAADAASSLNQLSDIASDAKVTQKEKIKAKAEYVDLINERDDIVAKATQMGLDRYATDYTGAITALQVYLNGAGFVGASPTYTWTNVTGTTTIVRATWDTKWADVYYNRQTVLNAIADAQIAGDDIVVNGGFESRTDPRCVTGGFTTQIGTMLADSWEVLEAIRPEAWNVISDTNVARIRSGTRGLAWGFANGYTLAAGLQSYVMVGNPKKIVAKPGDRFRVRAAVTETFSTALNTGLRRMLFVGLRCYNAAGTVIADAGLKWDATTTRSPTPGTSAANQQEAIVTIPANVASFRVAAYAYVSNTTGASMAVNNSCVILGVDDVEVMRWNGGHLLTEAGSLEQIGDLRNINPTGHANVAAAWTSGAITYTAAAGSPASATISFSASNLRLAGVNIAYSAASVGVTGTNGSSIKYYLYFDDPTFAGGAKTLGATTAIGTLVNDKNRVYVGDVTVNFPSAGSGGGGGVTPCVMSSAYVPEGKGYRKMGSVRAAEVIEGFNPISMEPQPMVVYSSEEVYADCVRVVCENGCVLPCSVYAKVWAKDKGWTLSPNLLGKYLWTRKHGKFEWSLVVDLVRVGQQLVNHVVGEKVGEYDTTGAFAAGEEPDMYVYGHHNIKNS